jgi:hypothetical protein
MPDRHRITCAAMQLDIVGEPLVPAPAHGLPIEYMEGPYRYRGTLAGQPVTAFAFNERSLALYRDWELVQVLTATVANLEPAEPELSDSVDRIRSLVASGSHGEASQVVREAIEALAPDRADECRGVLAALSDALSDVPS